MPAAEKPNLHRWKDWRLSALVEAEKKEKKDKEEKAEEIGPESMATKVEKPKIDNEGKREVVEVLGKRFYLDTDNVTSKTGHTFTWIEICSLYEYGVKEKYIKEVKD